MCLGAIAGSQGVRGLVRIKAFTENPEDVAAYGPLSDEKGDRRFDLTITGQARGLITARIEGVSDRDAAEALRGTRLYVDRALLPRTDHEDEYYHADLLGMAAFHVDGKSLGTVRAIMPVGETDVLEIAEEGQEEPLLVPFTLENVPEVDVMGRRLTVDPPLDPGDEDGAQHG